MSNQIKNKINIIEVEIKVFRNLKDVKFNLDKKHVKFSGANHIGKTNVLNAIFWCLTGADLSDSANNDKNIPFGTARETGKTLVDVIVTTNNGKVERKIIDDKGSNKEILTINNIECESVKDGEVQIDQVLGILPLTLKKKAINIRKFLLNPMYLFTVEESKFRAFVMDLIVDDEINRELLRQLPELTRSLLKNECERTNYSVDAVSKVIADAFKKNKKETDKVSIIHNYLISNKDLVKQELIEKVEDDVFKLNEEHIKLTESQSALDSYVKLINQEYNKIVKDKFGGLTINLYTKGHGDDVWKETCRPMLANGIPLQYGSTSEKIITTCLFLNLMVTGLTDVATIPVLIDEYETLDAISSKFIQYATDSQIIGAEVSQIENKRLTMEVIKNERD